MRITKKDLYKTIERFEDVTGIKTTLNHWHKHVSLHVALEAGACGDRIACGSSIRECYEQLQAILDFKYVYDKHQKEQQKQASMMALSLDLGAQDD